MFWACYINDLYKPCLFVLQFTIFGNMIVSLTRDVSVELANADKIRSEILTMRTTVEKII